MKRSLIKGVFKNPPRLDVGFFRPSRRGATVMVVRGYKVFSSERRGRVSEEDNVMLWPASDSEVNRQRATLLRALAREADSPEIRAEFERLALQYERLAGLAPQMQSKIVTLGDLLSAKGIKWGRFEVEWVEWLQGTARRDRRAFQTLYLWTHRFVLALMKAITKDKSAADEATMSVFQDVWQRAATYDPTDDTVISWIMNQARSRALSRQFFTHIGPPRSPRGSNEVWEAIWECRELQKTSAVPAIESEPDLSEPGPGISCKVLAADIERSRLSMLVRLAPGGEYPPHTHAGIEQLYLFLGELWIDDRKLCPGDYNRAEAGTADKRVWSETGCTCILVTSSCDILT